MTRSTTPIDVAPSSPAPLPLRRQVTRGQRLLYLLGPILVTVLLGWLVWIIASRRVAWELISAAGLSIFGMGTTVIFTPAVVPDIVVGTWDLAWLVMYVNAASAFFYAYNLDLLERVPKLGPYLRRARMNAVVQLQEHPWVRRLATFGVGLFVFSPLPGSGSFGGCLAGRIVGLTAWASFVIVSIAGAFVAVGYAAGGRALEKWLDANDLSTPVRVAGALVAIALVSLLVTIVRRLARAPLPSEAEGTGGEAATDDA